MQVRQCFRKAIHDFDIWDISKLGTKKKHFYLQLLKFLMKPEVRLSR